MCSGYAPSPERDRMPPVRVDLVFAIPGAIIWGFRRSFWRSLRQFPGGKDGGTSGLVSGTGRGRIAPLLEWERLDGPSTAGAGARSTQATATAGGRVGSDGRIRTTVP